MSTFAIWRNRVAVFTAYLAVGVAGPAVLTLINVDGWIVVTVWLVAGLLVIGALAALAGDSAASELGRVVGGSIALLAAVAVVAGMVYDAVAPGLDLASALGLYVGGPITLVFAAVYLLGRLPLRR